MLVGIVSTPGTLIYTLTVLAHCGRFLFAFPCFGQVLQKLAGDVGIGTGTMLVGNYDTIVSA